MGKRHLAREYCIQALYLADISAIAPEKAFLILDYNGIPLESRTYDFARQLTIGTCANLKQIDCIVQAYAHNWRIERMSIVDRSILRMACYELIADLSTPVNVIIDEAIELAKKYSTENSGAFTNGILDRLKEERGKTSFNPDTKTTDSAA